MIIMNGITNHNIVFLYMYIPSQSNKQMQMQNDVPHKTSPQSLCSISKEI